MTTRTGGRWFEPVAEPPAPTAQLEPHPLALIFPEVTGPDFDELVANIRANGLAEEIVTHEGKILDGRTRYAACKAAGVEPRYQPFERIINFEGGPLDYVVSKNLTRRHLTTSQRAAIAADLAERKGESRARDEKGRLQATVGIPTLAKAAKTLSVSRDSVAVARKVKKASPELHGYVKAGKTSLNEAEKAIKRSKQAAEDPAAEPVLEGEILTGELMMPHTDKDGGGVIYVGEPEIGPAGLHRQLAGMRADESAAPTGKDEAVDRMHAKAAAEYEALNPEGGVDIWVPPGNTGTVVEIFADSAVRRRIIEGEIVESDAKSPTGEILGPDRPKESAPEIMRVLAAWGSDQERLLALKQAAETWTEDRSEHEHLRSAANVIVSGCSSWRAPKKGGRK